MQSYRDLTLTLTQVRRLRAECLAAGVALVEADA